VKVAVDVSPWPRPAAVTSEGLCHAWRGLHQKLTRQAGWLHHTGELPIVPGTVIRIKVERLPGNRAPEDL
jgi:hypothetical protein